MTGGAVNVSYPHSLALVMSTPPTLHPVARPYWSRGAPPPWAWAWSDADSHARSEITLSAELTAAEVGSVVAGVVHSGQLEVGPTPADWLDALLAFAPFTLDGGVAATDGEREVGPSCCCSVKTWREWQQFLADGSSPWMGHDPTGWAEWVGDVARVWKDGGYHHTPDGFVIDFPRERFATELTGVEAKLSGFLNRVEEWAAAIGYGDPPSLRRVFAESVGVER